MDRAYLSSPQEVLAHFRVDQERGLSSDQVEKNRLVYGSNGTVKLDIPFCEWVADLVWQRSRMTRLRRCGSSFLSSSRISW